MIINKVSLENVNNLDDLVNLSDNGTAFCYSYFLKLKNVKYLLKVDDGEKLLCIFPLFQNGEKIEQSTMYVPYGGPIFFLKNYSYRKALLMQREIVSLLISYLQNNYYEICFSCDTSMLDLKSFVKCGVIPEVRYTYKINLTLPLDEITNQYCKDRKKDLRRAIRNRLKLVYDDDVSIFDLDQALIWEKKYGNISSKLFVKQYLKQSINNKKGKIFIAKYKDEIIGGVAIVFDKNSAYIMYSYYNHKYDVGTIPFLYDALIKFLKTETDCRYLDFEGSVFEEIEKWNLSFGAKQFLYFNYYWQKENKEEIYKDLYDYGEK